MDQRRQRRSWTQARVPTGYQEQGCCLEGLTEVALFEAPPSMIFCSCVSAGRQEAPQGADIVFRIVRRQVTLPKNAWGRGRPKYTPRGI